MRTAAAGGSVAPRGDRGGAGPGRALDPGPAQRGQGAELRQRLGVREYQHTVAPLIGTSATSAGRRLRRRELRHGAAVLPLQVRPPPPGRAEGRVCRRQVGVTYYKRSPQLTEDASTK